MGIPAFNPVAGQAPTSNTDATITYTAPTDGSRWVLSSVGFSYNATPTGGQLIIAWGAFQEVYYIATAGPGVMSFPQFKRFPANTAVTVTLKAGGSSVTGAVYPNMTNSLSG